MDGAPVRGESIPIRVFLAGYDLAPTMRDINKKFSVRYYLNLVLMDEEDRRYFKQQVNLYIFTCFLIVYIFNLYIFFKFSIVIFLFYIFKMKILLCMHYFFHHCIFIFTIAFRILFRKLHYGGKVRKAESRKRPRHICHRI